MSDGITDRASQKNGHNSDKRDLVVVSGYYGFGNLGDEAILEQLTNELTRLVDPHKIHVLSAEPASTETTYGVRAADRWNQLKLAQLLLRSSLFISGGGGLFQDVRSAGSPIFYGGQLAMARALGAKAVVYAQGLGPLDTRLGKLATRHSWRLANAVSVRDPASLEQCRLWNIGATLTADPVWCLEATPLPEAVGRQVLDLKAAVGSGMTIGVSLRESTRFTQEHLEDLAAALLRCKPDAGYLLLPLQPEQDLPWLMKLKAILQAGPRPATILDVSEIQRPSQWLSVIECCQFVVGMRLHALIMALKSGLPVIGINYDPKVLHLLTEFEQPILNLTKESGSEPWESVLKVAFTRQAELSVLAVGKTESAKNLACQNFKLLARILGMQSDP